MGSSKQVSPTKMTTEGYQAVPVEFEGETRVCGCLCVNNKYKTIIADGSVRIHHSYGDCCMPCVGCCTVHEQRVIPYTSIQSIGINHGGILKYFCCFRTSGVWFATIASGLRFPHWTKVGKKENMENVLETVQDAIARNK